MAKFEDILKAQGFSDEEIAAQSTLDVRVKKAIEDNYGTVEQRLTAYEAENNKWAKYNEEHVIPTVSMYEKEKADAVALAASLEARLKLAEQNGYAPKRDETVVTPKTPEVPAFDGSKYVGKGEFEQGIAKFADLEGQAIAQAADLNEEYRYLMGGKSLFDYSMLTKDGRTLRGMTALRAEALESKQNLGDYIAKKFDFAGARAKIEADQRAKAEESIRADERAKVMGTYGDPNQRPLVPSNNPFIPRPAESGKMPWDRTQQERSRDRVSRAMQIQSGVVN